MFSPAFKFPSREAEKLSSGLQNRLRAAVTSRSASHMASDVAAWKSLPHVNGFAGRCLSFSASRDGNLNAGENIRPRLHWLLCLGVLA